MYSLDKLYDMQGGLLGLPAVSVIATKKGVLVNTSRGQYIKLRLHMKASNAAQGDNVRNSATLSIGHGSPPKQ